MTYHCPYCSGPSPTEAEHPATCPKSFQEAIRRLSAQTKVEAAFQHRHCLDDCPAKEKRP